MPVISCSYFLILFISVYSSINVFIVEAFFLPLLFLMFRPRLPDVSSSPFELLQMMYLSLRYLFMLSLSKLKDRYSRETIINLEWVY